jgi:hypothetical protein
VPGIALRLRAVPCSRCLSVLPGGLVTPIATAKGNVRTAGIPPGSSRLLSLGSPGVLTRDEAGIGCGSFLIMLARHAHHGGRRGRLALLSASPSSTSFKIIPCISREAANPWPHFVGRSRYLAAMNRDTRLPSVADSHRCSALPSTDATVQFFMDSPVSAIRNPYDPTLPTLCVGDHVGEAMLTCPVCEGWDQTQPVPAVVRSQTVVESTVRVGGAVGYGRNGIFPVITTDRTVMTGATQLARMLTLPVPRRPSGMCFFGWVLILLGAVPAVLIGIASQGQEAHSVSMWSSLSAGLVPGIVVWLPGIFFAIAGYSRLRAYDREGPIRDMTRRVWSSAGYCARDDVVFLPDGSRAAPARALSMMYNSACQILTAQSRSAKRT